MGLGSLKSSGQASRLEILAGVDAGVLSPKAVWRKNSFIFGGPQSFLLRTWNDWVRPTYINEGTLPYSKSMDLHVNHTLKILVQQYLDRCLTEYLGIVTYPSWHIHLIITLINHQSEMTVFQEIPKHSNDMWEIKMELLFIFIFIQKNLTSPVLKARIDSLCLLSLFDVPCHDGQLRCPVRRKVGD